MFPFDHLLELKKKVIEDAAVAVVASDGPPKSAVKWDLPPPRSWVQRELKICKNGNTLWIRMSTHGAGTDVTHLTGTTVGLAGTPYKGGTFELDI